ncbi:lipoamide acyltransferase component of branched-chain alpha-keto acid dehydrogenase complex, mitochondrial [Coccinella septempunctata]|uniref:lipoamide acyltransferase component of branched-chain alpha-keto acid dehydrogenase complex, mitochondrial n=1 Tax=Coccinella septempunctata TaxID=41139 RepID=UPI001D08387C|nr:lipoamide acyltransferase component of branched-chain alpha-keto acid dehydrogenase complex, mitochondrial [Coccinella septempunctata]
MAFIGRTQMRNLINNYVSKQNDLSLRDILREIHSSARVLGNIIPFTLSDIGEGITEVAVKEWFIKEGDKVAQFDNICEVQSDKASVTITSRYDGVVKKIHYDIDQTAYVGKPLIDIEVEDEPKTASKLENPNKTIPGSIDNVKQLASDESQYENDYSLCIPSVRRLARQYKIDLRHVKGTGKNSRILKEDVLRFLDKNNEEHSNTSIADVGSKEEVVKLQGFQKAMFQTMTASLSIPHFNYTEEIRITKLSALREELNKKSESGIKLSFVPFFIKAISLALSEYPLLNSSLDLENESITVKKYHNIGIAMDTKVGLAVPVIHDVQNKRIYEIAQELNRLMEKGKNGNFAIEDLKNGTFTLSNIGTIGGVSASPVILTPQIGIAAIGAIQTVPKFDENFKVYAEKVLYMTGAGDHRIIDGATMAKFINSIKKYIENPYLLLLKS